MRPLAGICLDVMEALDIPVCLNLYITAAGQKTSAPPHTDKQDVFVMQTQARYIVVVVNVVWLGGGVVEGSAGVDGGDRGGVEGCW